MSKEHDLYQHLLSGKRITHYEAVKRWKTLDFRKAMTRMRRYFKKHGKAIESQWRYRAEGKKIIKYKEHWLGTSTNTRRVA